MDYNTMEKKYINLTKNTDYFISRLKKQKRHINTLCQIRNQVNN